ncbi:MAG TPA: aspartyl/asparaginyl beta-hydroxylase domain-containing protein, partial [Candidatus Binatia bacterium]|nr:aspartyl/asparaginyl beta-hydroxylase domain-containing protein [Candidatus Binatia bacterium]
KLNRRHGIPEPPSWVGFAARGGRGAAGGGEDFTVNFTEATAALQKRRKKYVRRYGKRTLRTLDRYFARQSLVPTTPVLDSPLFPWTVGLEAQWQAVRAELETLLQHREALPLFQDIASDQYGISADDKWRAFAFYGFGYRSENNSRFCPQTARLLDRVPGIENAFFSILSPGKVIPSHRGVTKGLIRCHLGLIVPPEPERCFMDIGDMRCTWQEGRLLLFDDTYPHAVQNNTAHERVVLLFDFLRPLTAQGRLVRRVLFWFFRRSAFVQDAIRREMQWERHFHQAC